MPVTPPADLERRVLDVVASLVDELAGGASRDVRLDDSLDRDLGISSLERVELLLRLEQTFDVRLPDAVMAEAGSPRDLAAAILRADPRRLEGLATAGPAARETPPAPASVPTHAHSLDEVLRWHADRTPDRTHLYLRNDDGTETAITYGELARAAAEMGASLRRRGVAGGDRVALMLRTERAFFETFLAALAIGAVPVPLYPPIRSDDLVVYARRQQAILRNAEARLLVTFAEAERLASLLGGQVPSLETIALADDLRTASGPAPEARLRPEDPALIQYTSGSTGDPKGVLLSHANVLANVRAIGQALEIHDGDVAVSWLPLYHDMGLIGMWLGALYFGAPVAIMSPLAFLSRPSRWLWAIHSHGGTISAAPNFAFDLCARAIPDSELAGLDLSRWRVAVNGSEAVSAATLRRFADRFAPYGFSAESLCPAYGLAESSVALTLGALRRAPRVERAARAPFERGRAIQPAPAGDPRALAFVSCGRPLPGHELRIVDRSGRPLGERVDGRIQFRGPSVTHGYFRNPDLTRAVTHDGWMDSGDLGYRADGELFVTGREKDLIIQGGRNLCAEEVEAIVSNVAGIRANCVAAFGIPDPAAGTERVVVVAETRERDPGRREALRRAVQHALVDGIGSPPDAVVIADPRTVLKTSSGKIRRTAMRDAYLNGSLGARRSAAGQRARLLAGAFAGFIRKSAGWAGRALFTSWVLIVLAASVPVLWVYLIVRSPGRHADRAVKRWSRLALAACGLRPRVLGLQHLRSVDSGILVVNHASYIDTVVLMAAIPANFHFVAKRALLKYPLIGTVIQKAGHLTIEKAGLGNRLAGADDVERRLREGDRLAIFPEGTFARRAGLLPFRLGAFRAAVDTNRSIVPVALAGTRDVLPDGTWLFRRAPVTVTIGFPMAPRDHGWPEMVRLRDAAVQRIARECGESSAAARAAT